MKARTGLRGVWVGVVAVLFSAQASATGIPVVDALHIVQTTYGHYAKYVQDAIQYGKEIEEWKRTYDHYRQ